jgi:hypothetical protein
MESYNLLKISDEILVYSLQPRRFRVLVKLIRKLLWRFIRPFHFYQIQEIYQLHERQIQALKKMSCEQENKINNFFVTVSSAKSELNSNIRSEYIPLMNRIASLENENDLLIAKIDEIKDFLKTDYRK